MALDQCNNFKLTMTLGDNSDFNDKTHDLDDLFRARDYPESILQEAIRNISFITAKRFFPTNYTPPLL